MTHNWQTDGIVRRHTVDGYEVDAIAIGSANGARAVALAYAGFGDGQDVSNLIAAAPRMLRTLREIARLAETGARRKGMTASTQRASDLQAIAAMAIAELALSSTGE
jgi:hypothetical protein